MTATNPRVFIESLAKQPLFYFKNPSLLTLRSLGNVVEFGSHVESFFWYRKNGMVWCCCAVPMMLCGFPLLARAHQVD
jgi:hypothetical protein